MRFHTGPLSASQRNGGSLIQLGGGRATWTASARTIIRDVYKPTSPQMPELPEWAQSAYYDIELSEGGNAPPERWLAMKQNLLQEKFKLKAHPETKTMQAYLLSVAAGAQPLPKPGACMPSLPKVFPPVRALQLGDVLADRYETGEFVGAGGMGEVYKAFASDHWVPIQIVSRMRPRPDFARRGLATSSRFSAGIKPQPSLSVSAHSAPHSRRRRC
jgi:hypothetical protein